MSLESYLDTQRNARMQRVPATGNLPQGGHAQTMYEENRNMENADTCLDDACTQLGRAMVNGQLPVPSHGPVRR